MQSGRRLRRPDRTARVAPSPVPPEQTSRFYPTWLPSRRFISAVIAIGGMQLLATMDSTVAIVALPKIQDELACPMPAAAGSSPRMC